MINKYVQWGTTLELVSVGGREEWTKFVLLWLLFFKYVGTLAIGHAHDVGDNLYVKVV